ncbi:MAG TPA: hypothetical protein VEH30_02205 [Terriglobales bacterium]|nr:hypothetical protein [Terriglobales bacterium]
MKRIFVIVAGIAIFATASTMISGVQSSSRTSNAQRATDAAYRDGLFLGQLDANQGRAAHLSIGRWSSAADRESFTAGYKAGYDRIDQGHRGDI